VWLGLRVGRLLRPADPRHPDDVARLLALGSVWLSAGFGLVLILEGAAFAAQSWWCGGSR
jgi:hypothetical protein